MAPSPPLRAPSGEGARYQLIALIPAPLPSYGYLTAIAQFSPPAVPTANRAPASPSTFDLYQRHACSFWVTLIQWGKCVVTQRRLDGGGLHGCGVRFTVRSARTPRAATPMAGRNFMGSDGV